MNHQARRILAYLLPPFVTDAIRLIRKTFFTKPGHLERYLRERTPYTIGYYQYREQFLANVLAQEPLLKKFRTARPLPPSYGLGLCERCVEYPWVLSNLSESLGDVLDAGSALNHEFLLKRMSLDRLRLTILNLAPEGVCYWNLGISYLFRDICFLPFQDSTFQTITCVSTLEHVGLSNQVFLEHAGQVGARENQDLLDEKAYLQAVHELKRVLAPGGVLLLTVPFGRKLVAESHQVFTSAMLEEVVDVFEPKAHTLQFYLYSRDGWQLAQQDECADQEYVGWIMERDPKPKFPIQSDGAVAARAVACLRLEKK